MFFMQKENKKGEKRMKKEIIEKTSDDSVLDAFHNIQSKNEMAEVLKELFDKGKLQMIGDLTKDEIKLATRIYMIAEMKHIEVWKKGLTYYMTLLISKNRKSRREILDAIKGYWSQPSLAQKAGSLFNRNR